MSDSMPRRTKMEQQSAETRSRIVAAAYGLFCDQGFRATTMESIGAAAGVSVQTVYFQFRTKNAVLKAVHEWTVLGDDGLPPVQQPWYLAALAAPDAATLVHRLVAGTADLNHRIAPTLPIFATLAREPAGEIYRTSRRMRREGMEHVIAILQERGELRADLAPRRAADILDFLMGPEAYAELVGMSGWARHEWIAWTAQSLTEELLATTGKI